ncbi:hypothetical protein IGI04_036051 [Brassica rapa subsp. trilocularis]|uniref:Uncharacterized protein n=1 Tax=Brassica rapa subsp. trilocularis TaxID=1813537 RepID=A0ABQ7LFS2_BRACM|nr:hypothetical protein IGI04_036051 [Brassica rapa subsp. trilocularis]
MGQIQGRLGLSISTHISTLVLGLSTLALPVDCSVDFGPRGLSVQYTQDVRGCPSAHTGRPWVSVSTHRTSVGVRQHTQDVRGCPCVSVSTHRTSVAVHQYTFSTLVLGLSTLTLPVDCSGDFGPRGLSVQYTQDVHGYPPAHTGRLWLSVCVRQHTHDVCGCPSVHISARWSLDSARWPFPWTVRDVRGCPSAHTGRPWVSVSTHRTSVAVRVCPSAHTRRPWLSISTHISTLVLGLSMLTLPVDCTGDFGPRGLSVQYSHDVRGCPPAHTGRPWLSVCDCVCPCVSVSTHRTSVVVHQYTYQHAGPWTQHAGPSLGLFETSVGVRQHTQYVCGCPSAHTGRPWLSVCVRVFPSAHTERLWLSISTHISTLVLGLSTLTLPVDCSGDFGQRGLSVQYTQDVCGCLPAHTGRRWLSVCVRVCDCVCPSAHTGHLWLSINKYISTLALPVDCSGDFGPRRLSIQYTQDVRGCPPSHTGRPWLSVCVCVCPSAHTGHLRLSINIHICTLVFGFSMLALPVDCSDDFGPRRLWMSVSTHMTSVAVRVCPSAHTGRLWLSISTHISMLVLGLSTLTLLVDRSGDFGPRGLSVQYTQDVRGCPPAHIGRPWLSVCVRQHTQDVRGCPSVHISARWSLDSAHWPFPWTVRVILAHVGCLFSTHRTTVGVSQHTHDVHWCPSAQTGRLWLSACIRVCMWVSVSTHRPSVGVRQHTQDVCGCPCVSVCVLVCPLAHTGRPWLSISTHVSTLVLGLSMLTLPVDCSGDFGPRGLSVQYTQHVRGCPQAHTGRLWLTLVLGLSTLALPLDCSSDFGTCGLSVQYTQDVRGCPSAHTRRPWVSFSTHSTSVAVRQHTRDICGCPSAHTVRLWVSVSTHNTSVAVRVCLFAHTGLPWLSISTHISTLVFGLSTLTLPMDCSGDFVPRGLSVQYTQDVCGCLFSTHRTSVGVCQHTQDIRGCPCVSVCVRQHTQDVRGCPSVHISARWSLGSDAAPSCGLFGVILAHVAVCSVHTVL